MIKDKILNKIYQFMSIKRYFLKTKSIECKIGNEYKICFYDDFSNDTIGKNWLRSHEWGFYHPDNLTQYYGLDNDVSFIKDNKMHLLTKKEPLIISNTDNTNSSDEFTIPYKVGLVRSVESWKYGWFIASIKMPIGKYLWPAFWLTGENAWPPEIDIVECYSDSDSLYSKKLLGISKKHWKIQPNVHYKKLLKNEMWGPYNCPISNMTNEFVEFALNWEKDFIKIFYNGYLVLKITDKKILNFINEYKQVIILNNGVNLIGKYDNLLADGSDMQINYVKVYQKNS